MKHIVSILSLLLIAMSSVTAQEAGDDLLAKESLGGLQLGMSEKALAPFLGKAAVSKSESVLEGATGEYIQTWECKEKGLTLRMSSGEKKKGPKTVSAFTAHGKCTLATVKGIKLGSKKAEVVKAYGKVEDKEMSSPTSFVAGSIYGGIIFTIKDGKVSEIFFGAAAE
ncbi:MAG: hypothetical protein JNJ83_11415 [Verrucomicrobiaceae bacterium]|nr:hypothetical protein [Verrucomicrobiaceae bacterium]